MRTIGDLLLKYPIPGVRHAEIRRVCAEEIALMTGCILTSKQVKYKDEQLFLTVPSVLKSALVLRQSELTSCLASKGITIKKIT